MRSALPWFLAVAGTILMPSKVQAIIDANRNGLSDLWEETYFNGELLPPQTDLEEDADSDGWTTREEAAAGTSPFDGNPPSGIVRIGITTVPATYHDPDEDGVPDLLSPKAALLTWPTVAGKRYDIFASLDLAEESWFLIVDGIIGDGNEMGQAVAMTQPDGSEPERIFFRISVSDTDRDYDLLSDAEERELGTNPLTPYSDTDYLTDYDEVVSFGTNPTAYDSNADGIVDHHQISAVGQAPATDVYKPKIDFIGVSRSVMYQLTESRTDPPEDPTGTLTLSASWDSSLDSGEKISKRMGVADLRSRLGTSLPFPSPDQMAGAAKAGFGALGKMEIEEHSESGQQVETRIIMRASFPPTQEIRRNLMILHYTHAVWQKNGNLIPSQLINMESKTMTIPAGGLRSDPVFIGDGAQVSYVATAPEFWPMGDYVGWDDSGSEVWRALNVGMSSEGWLRMGGVSEQLKNLVEVVPDAASQAHVSLSDFKWGVNGATFKVNGLSATGDSGAKIVFRSKLAPSMVFATLNVRVFPITAVPFSVIRIWDSRVPSSHFSGGPSDQEIMEALKATFITQSGLVFYPPHQYEGLLDIRHDPSQPSTGPDEKLRFKPDGRFSSDLIEGLDELTEKLKPAPAKITVHVVKRLDEWGMHGAALKDRFTCVISSEAPTIQGPDGTPMHHVYPHEVGHILRLSTQGVGQGNSHDFGPWPWFWREGSWKGLMHEDSASAWWIRQQDWLRAHKSVIEFNLHQTRP